MLNEKWTHSGSFDHVCFRNTLCSFGSSPDHWVWRSEDNITHYKNRFIRDWAKKCNKNLFQNTRQTSLSEVNVNFVNVQSNMHEVIPLILTLNQVTVSAERVTWTDDSWQVAKKFTHILLWPNTCSWCPFPLSLCPLSAWKHHLCSLRPQRTAFCHRHGCHRSASNNPM